MVAHWFQNLRFLIPTPKQIKAGIKVYYKTRGFNERQEYGYELKTALFPFLLFGLLKPEQNNNYWTYFSQLLTLFFEKLILYSDSHQITFKISPFLQQKLKFLILLLLKHSKTNGYQW